MKKSKLKVVAIIPARMSSSRFPNKPLFPILGIPMIEHVRRRVETSKAIDDVWVATCDEEIKKVVESFGGKVVMTGNQHRGATDRIAEAAEKIEGDIFINMQGDEPMVMPEVLGDLVKPFFEDSNLECTNIYYPIVVPAEITDDNVVKVTLSESKKFLYLSRSPIPCLGSRGPAQYFKQAGIIAFTRKSLSAYYSFKPTPLEVRESVDILRLLEHDYSIQGVYSGNESIGVDILEQIKMVEEQLKTDPIQNKIFKEAVLSEAILK